MIQRAGFSRPHWKNKPKFRRGQPPVRPASSPFGCDPLHSADSPNPRKTNPICSPFGATPDTTSKQNKPKLQPPQLGKTKPVRSANHSHKTNPNCNHSNSARQSQFDPPTTPTKQTQIATTATRQNKASSIQPLKQNKPNQSKETASPSIQNSISPLFNNLPEPIHQSPRTDC